MAKTELSEGTLWDTFYEGFVKHHSMIVGGHRGEPAPGVVNDARSASNRTYTINDHRRVADDARVTYPYRSTTNVTPTYVKPPEIPKIQLTDRAPVATFTLNGQQMMLLADGRMWQQTAGGVVAEIPVTPEALRTRMHGLGAKDSLLPSLLKSWDRNLLPPRSVIKAWRDKLVTLCTGEAYLIICKHKTEQNKWLGVLPLQKAFGGGVETFDNEPSYLKAFEMGYEPIGNTLHLHPGTMKCASSVDTAEWKKSGGVYLIAPRGCNEVTVHVSVLDHVWENIEELDLKDPDGLPEGSPAAEGLLVGEKGQTTDEELKELIKPYNWSPKGTTTTTVVTGNTVRTQYGNYNHGGGCGNHGFQPYGGQQDPMGRWVDGEYVPFAGSSGCDPDAYGYDGMQMGRGGWVNPTTLNSVTNQAQQTATPPVSSATGQSTAASEVVDSEEYPLTRSQRRAIKREKKRREREEKKNAGSDPKTHIVADKPTDVADGSFELFEPDPTLPKDERTKMYSILTGIVEKSTPATEMACIAIEVPPSSRSPYITYIHRIVPKTMATKLMEAFPGGQVSVIPAGINTPELEDYTGADMFDTNERAEWFQIRRADVLEEATSPASESIQNEVAGADMIKLVDETASAPAQPVDQAPAGKAVTVSATEVKDPKPEEAVIPLEPVS